MFEQIGMGLIISLKDAFTQSARGIASSADSLDKKMADTARNIESSTKLVTRGAMMMGAGLGMMAVPVGLVASTLEVQHTLGSLSAEGVKDLKAMEDAATDFTNKWAGYSKVEFLNSAWEIKGALSELSDQQVATTTGLINLTAKATRGAVNDMTEAMTKGYYIFKRLNADMNTEDWFGSFSSAMTETVNVFATDGSKMAIAIRNLGDAASSRLVPIAEQLAIIGSLQNTKVGEMAGTYYKQFLNKVYEGGKTLGIQIMDNNQHLLSMPQILENVSKRFGDLNSVAVQAQIKDAFGSEEAVAFLQSLLSVKDTIPGAINQISEAFKGGAATTIASAQRADANIWGLVTRTKQQVRNLIEELGNAIAPFIAPFVSAISRVSTGLQEIIRTAPNFFGAIGALVFYAGAVVTFLGGIVALAGAVKLSMLIASMAVVVLKASFASAVAYFWPVALAIIGVTAVIVALRMAWSRNFGGIRDTIVAFADRVRMVFQGIRELVTSLSGSTGIMSAALAEKLQAAGLMGFVTGLFRVYYRVRQFFVGIGEVVGPMVSRAFQLLSNAASGLLSAFGSLLGAVLSLFRPLGLLATATDPSPWRTFGNVVGFVFGAIAQAIGVSFRIIYFGISIVLRGFALVVRVISFVVNVVATVAVAMARWLYRIMLPVQLVVAAFVFLVRAIGTVFRMATGEIGLVEGLRSIGRAFVDFVLTPWRWILGLFGFSKDQVAGIMASIRGSIGAVFNGLIAGARIAWDAFWGVLRPVYDMFRAMVLPVIDQVRESFSNLFGSKASKEGSTLLNLVKAMRPAAEFLGRVFRAVGYVVGFLAGAIVKAMVVGPIKAVAYAIVMVAGAIKAVIDGVLWIRNAFVSVWNGVTGFFGSIASSMFGFGQSVVGSLVAGIQSVGYRVAKAIMGLFPGGRFLFDKVMGQLAPPAPPEAPKNTPVEPPKVAPAEPLKPVQPTVQVMAKAPAVQRPAVATQMVRAAAVAGIAATAVIQPPVSPGVPQKPQQSANAPVQQERATQGNTAPRSTFVPVPRPTTYQPAAQPQQVVVAGADRADIEAIVAALADRPINVTVVSKLDGQEVSRAVYRNMREEKVKSYQTL